MEQVKRMLEFIEKSPSCYQVVENVQKELETAGYVPLKTGNGSFLPGENIILQETARL